jgi:two-component system chemotaxis response regulator CheB
MAKGGKIAVMIVEDSTVVRMFLEGIISDDPRLTVVASVPDAESALRLLPTVRPDVISLDVRLPGMNGLEATRRIMEMQPTPIVIVSASVEAEDLKISMNALRAGALTVVEKPTAPTSEHYAIMAERLCRQLAIMSEVVVIRQRGLRSPVLGREPPDDAPVAQLSARTPIGGYRALGIVASTGGPNAVALVLQTLGKDYPLPILLVQHITPSFLDGFVMWLEDISPFRVAIGQQGEVPSPGHVYVPPRDRHLELVGARINISDGPPESGQKPSGSVLLRSMGRSLGQRALAAILTGMGEDGADGLKAVFDAGGYTIAEDRSTAIVYGMPAAAVRARAVSEQLPLPEIGRRLREVARLERMVT